MNRGVFWFSVLLVACGGSAEKAPSTPDEAAAESGGNDESNASDKSEAAEAGEAKESASGEAKSGDTKSEESGGGEITPKEMQTVLQLFVGDEELNRALHLDKPGRFPLKMSGKDLPSNTEVTNGNHPVSIVGEPKSDKDPVLVVTKIETEPKSVTIGFEYAVEKIRGTAHYKKTSFGWELASIRTVER
jgi:hypothetical protein